MFFLRNVFRFYQEYACLSLQGTNIFILYIKGFIRLNVKTQRNYTKDHHVIYKN